MRFVSAEEILRATDGGLDIIKDLYPDAKESAHKPNRKFKIRSEKTASVSLHKKFDGEKGFDVWLVTDFGGDGKPKNGILCYAEEYNLSYGDALQELAQTYHVESAKPADLPRAEFSERSATNEEMEGARFFEIKESFSDFEIETLFAPNVLRNLKWYSGEVEKKEAYSKIRRICTKYNFFPLKSYSIVKGRKVMTFSATDNYPMFVFDEREAGFAKIYQPKSADKAHRFLYTGERPKDFVHGLIQAKEEHQKMMSASEEQESDYEKKDEETKKESRSVPKFDEIILASGGSDALNLLVLGYKVVWLNSESAEFTEKLYFDLMKMAQKVCQLQDIDTTGKEMAHRNAMKFLELYTIELPDKLKEYKDRGNPCKDLRDFFKHYKVKDFKNLIEIALPYRFWDRRIKEKSVTYEFNNVQAYNFLAKNGFYRLESPARKSGYMFVKVDGNVVRETEPNEVKNFVHEFLKERQLDNQLRNSMYRTTQLSDSSLSNLPFIEIDFTDNEKDRQFYVFENTTVEVTPSEILTHKPGRVSRFVWKQDVIEHNLKLREPAFKVVRDEEYGGYDIVINHHEDLFFNYLIQTSRVKWRKELEVEAPKLPAEEYQRYLKDNKFNITGPLLTEEEQNEQKQHLINKIFTIGYLLHRYKNPTRPWAVFAMDALINDDGGSYGGSGKSLLFNVAIPHLLRQNFYLGARDPKITMNPHIYDGLTEHHRYILVDDADEYLNFKFFFDMLTGKIKVNPKNQTPYTIDFENSGKLAITSNYAVRNLDPSTERRLLYAAFSDYYHAAGESSDYLETRTPADDFGKQLFSEFTREEWDHFYTTMLTCLQTYLTIPEKINPPMDNVSKRNLLAEMGPDFEAWASNYFAPEGSNVDCPVVREEAAEDFQFRYKKGWATRKFSSALKAFCKYHGYILNPKSLLTTKEGETPRIQMRVPVRKINRDGVWYDTGEKTTKDIIYVQTDLNTIPSLENRKAAPNDDVPKPVKPEDPNDVLF